MPIDVRVYLLLVTNVVNVVKCCDYRASLQNTEYRIHSNTLLGNKLKTPIVKSKGLYTNVDSHSWDMNREF